MNDQRKLAFESASGSAKQFIALSTGLLALTLTFAGSILEQIPSEVVWILRMAWGLHLGSIVCGAWVLLALTGQLEPLSPAPDHEPSINSKSVRLPAILQIGAFLLGTVLLVVAVWRAPPSDDDGEPREPTPAGPVTNGE